MKNFLVSFGMLLLVMGCAPTQHDDKTGAVTEEKPEIISESSVVYDPSGAIWNYDYNLLTNEFEIKQLRVVDNDTLTGEMLEKILNQAWPGVQIKFVKTSNDTAFIFIPDSKVLTQQMGSAGAESFMISTTYSFTELKGIEQVSISFEEGDHAIPGVYSRNSWGQNKNQ